MSRIGCLASILAMAMTTSHISAAERLSDMQLTSARGGGVNGCDRDCYTATTGCPTQVSVGVCDQTMHACRVCDFAKRDERCGDWHWDLVYITCSETSGNACPTGGRIGYCTAGGICIGDPAQPDPPDCN